MKRLQFSEIVHGEHMKNTLGEQHAYLINYHPLLIDGINIVKELLLEIHRCKDFDKVLRSNHTF